MIIIYILLFFIIVWKFRILKFNTEYLSFNSTNSIKGIFILLVFISHCNGYFREIEYEYNNFGDQAFLYIQRYIAQWIVALFLFYSGYGIQESIKKKGIDYIKGMPKKRILTVLLNFDVAVLCFLFLNIILNYPLTWHKCLLSFICWDDLGNSNWYIFTIIICYISVYSSFKITKYNYRIGLFLSCILIFFCMIILALVRNSYWYNTILCFPLGLIFSYYKYTIEKILKSFPLILLSSSLFLYIIGLKLTFSQSPVFYNISAIATVIFIITLTTRISINNKILIWLGAHLFPLYIYQRIPMIIFSETTIITNYPLLYWAICFVFTILIAKYYKYWQIKFI